MAGAKGWHSSFEYATSSHNWQDAPLQRAGRHNGERPEILANTAFQGVTDGMQTGVEKVPPQWSTLP